MSPLTTREKIAHLLRRFGFGATKQDLDRLEPLGVSGALDWLIDYEKHDEGFSISPWELCFEEGKDEVYVDAFRTSSWWSLRMVLSQRPLEQKLTLFWHDHFAVSANKVEFGPLMLTYIESIRRNALDFPAMLQAVSKEPAMLRFLDNDISIKQQPNENFAREVLELFTLGIGNYTEKDVQEAARAFTGWGNRYLIYESGGEQVQQRIKEAVMKELPMVAYCFSPDLNDTGAKTVLGTTKSFSGEELLAMLAAHPKTAENITAKLWDYFAGGPASDGTNAKLRTAFTDSKGQIKPVLRAIAASDEFWSDTSVRKRVKSPAEFVVPIVKQLDVSAFLLAAHAGNTSRTKPLAKPLRDTAGLVVGTMFQQGMLLLFPPDVGGWEWGNAWITPGNMLHRTNLANMICGVDQPDKGLVAYLATLVLAPKPADGAGAVDVMCEMFDAGLPEDKKKLLVQAFEKEGGLDSLKKPEGASKSLSAVLRLMWGSPEFQMC